jgi:hypothetical protein
MARKLSLSQRRNSDRVKLFAVAAAILLAVVQAHAGDRLIAAATGDSVIQDQPAGLQTLLHTLARVPDDDAWRAHRIAIYVDLRAAERAGAAVTPESGASLAGMDQAAFDRWSMAMSRIKLGPIEFDGEVGRARLSRAMSGVTSLFQGLPDVLGIDWFSIDRFISASHPRQPLVILDIAPQAAAASGIESTMRDHQFEPREAAGASFWARFDPGEVRADAAFPPDVSGGHFGDPFRIAYGHGAGVAFLPREIVGSADWSVVEGFLMNRRGAASLADDAAIVAAARAMTIGFADAELVQAVFAGIRLDAASVARAHLGQFATPAQHGTLQETYARRDDLACYESVALADLQDGADEVALVIAVYADGDVAHEAAPILAARVENYAGGNMSAPLLETVGAQVSAITVTTDSGYGAAIAVLRMTPKAEADISRMRPGRMFKFLIDGFSTADFDPLICE